MKVKSKIMSVGAVMMLSLSLGFAPVTLAWGPENRPTYTMEAPADHATFNSITDNALLGDERDFVRIVEDGVGAELKYGEKVENNYVSELTIEPGKRYRVYIYYHNDASLTYNSTEHNQIGVARDVRLISGYPNALAKNERQQIFAKITSSTTDPEGVWDEAYVTAKEALTLHYIQGSAKIYNHWFPNGEILTASQLFSSEGTFLGTDQMNGIIFGCDQFSGSVSYVLETKAVETPVDPEDPVDPPVDPEDPVDSPVDPEDPELPEELPEAGAAEIVLAVVIAVAVVAGVVYYRKTSRDVKKVTKKAKGKK